MSVVFLCGSSAKNECMRGREEVPAPNWCLSLDVCDLRLSATENSFAWREQPQQMLVAYLTVTILCVTICVQTALVVRAGQ